MPDRTIIGPFQVLGELGRGASGVVFRVRRAGDARDYALKVLQPHLVGDRDWLIRIQREQAALSAIDSPHVVRILESGTLDEGPYLLMECVGETSLAERLQTGPLEDPREAAAVGAAIARAIEAAHASGVIHRDLKPSNVLFADDGQVKVADFGVARADSSATMTGTASFVGTLRYSAPETIDGEFGPRSDLYSLGCILFEMLTGSPPFAASTALASFQRRLADEAPDILEIRGDTPLLLADLIRDLLQLRPERRPGDARQVAERLEACAGGDGRTGARGGVWARRVQRRLRRRRARVLLLGGTAMATAIVAVLIAADGSAPAGATMPTTNRSLIGGWTIAEAELPLGMTSPALAATERWVYLAERAAQPFETPRVWRAPHDGARITGDWELQGAITQRNRQVIDLAVANGWLYAFGSVPRCDEPQYLEHAAIDPDTGELGRFERVGQPTLFSREHARMVVAKDTVFLIGGYGCVDATSDQRRSVEAARILADGTIGPWRFVSAVDLPAGPLVHVHANFAATTDGEWLYVAGGDGIETGNPSLIAVERARVHDDGRLGRWESLPDLPVGRHAFRMAIAEDRLYVFGGASAPNGSPAAGLAEVISASAGADGLGQWRAEPPLPTGVYDYGLAQLPKGFLLAGGNYTLAGLTFLVEQASVRAARSDPCSNGCPTQPLIARASADPTTGDAPLLVRFADVSSGEPDSWHWDFGDGATSTEQSPEHEFREGGAYTATFDACTGDVCERATLEIRVAELPPAGAAWEQDMVRIEPDVVGPDDRVIEVSIAAKDWGGTSSGPVTFTLEAQGYSVSREAEECARAEHETFVSHCWGTSFELPDNVVERQQMVTISASSPNLADTRSGTLIIQ